MTINFPNIPAVYCLWLAGLAVLVIALIGAACLGRKADWSQASIKNIMCISLIIIAGITTMGLFIGAMGIGDFELAKMRHEMEQK